LLKRRPKILQTQTKTTTSVAAIRRFRDIVVLLKGYTH